MGKGKVIMCRFSHEKLDAYQAAVEFVVQINEFVKFLPRGRGYLSDQLQRAATSIPLNIAEGAGEFSKNEKARFYRIAKRSATECAAILEVCQRVGIGHDKYSFCRNLLFRIVAMLTKMIRNRS